MIIKVDHGVQLRAPKLNDAPALFNLIQANIDHLRASLPEVTMVKDIAEVANWIEPQINSKVHKQEIVFLIEIENEIKGVINVHSVDYEALFGELGYWISEDQTGKGIVTRCCAEFLIHCFESLKLNHIEATMIPANTGSIAVAKRLGMSYDGLRIRPADALPKGPKHMVVYSISAHGEEVDE